MQLIESLPPEDIEEEVPVRIFLFILGVEILLYISNLLNIYPTEGTSNMMQMTLA